MAAAQKGSEAPQQQLLVKIPIRYAPMVGLPFWQEGKEQQWARHNNTIAIKVDDAKTEQHARAIAATKLVGYGIPYQAAKSLINATDDKGRKVSTLISESDSRFNEVGEGKGKIYLQLENTDPYEAASKRAGITSDTALPLGQNRPFSTGVWESLWHGNTEDDIHSRPPVIPTGSGLMLGADVSGYRHDARPTGSEFAVEEGLGAGGAGILGEPTNVFTSDVGQSMTVDDALKNLELDLEEIRSEEARAEADAKAAEELARQLEEQGKTQAEWEAAREEERLAREALAELKEEEARIAKEAEDRLLASSADAAGNIREEGAWEDTAAPPGGLAESVLHPFGLTTTTGGVGSAFNVQPFSQGGNIGNVRVEDYIANIQPDQMVSRVEVSEGVFEMELNPLVAQMLDIATVQNGYISENQIAQTHKEQAVAVAEFQRDAAIRVAEKRGASEEEVATIQANASKAIATAQAEAEKAVATTQAGAQEAVATTQAGATTEAAASQAAAQTAAAVAAAQAASPFGYLAQADERDRNLALQDITSIYGHMNRPEMAQVQASGPFGFVGQTPEAGYTPDQVEQLMGIIQQQQQAQSLAALRDNPFAAAIYAQQVAGPEGAPVVGPEQALSISGIPLRQSELQAAASGPYGYMQERIGTGDPFERIRGLQEVSEILRGGVTPEQQLALAQAPGNPFGLTAQQQIDLQAELARGGLTPAQRLAEVQASASPQNMANYLNFIGDPSAVGFASQSGMLQNIADSPEGNIPASLFGLNTPQSTSQVPVNPTLANLSDLSDEQLGFYQGQQAAQGITPSQSLRSAAEVTPMGV